MGGKSPRHFSSLEEAETYYHDRLAKERQSDKNLKKEHKVNLANKKIALAANSDFDSDNDSLPDVSSASEFTEDTDFEEEVSSLASRKFNEWQKTTAQHKVKATKKTQSGGSVSTSSGKYVICS